MSIKRVLFINLRSHPIERVEPFYICKEIGVEVILLSDSKPNINENLYSELLLADTYNKESCLNEVLNYHNLKPISGVITWSDKDVELVSLITNELNLPGTSIESSKKARNKYLMREAWSNIDDISPRYRKITSLEELEKSVKDLGLPLIFKPTGASGSKSVFKIDSNTDLNKIYELMKRTTSPKKDKVYTYFPDEYILEEYLEGPEVTVDGFVQNGEIHFAGVVDKSITSQYSMEYCAIFPSNKSKEIINEIKSKAKKAILALGLDNTSFHLECRVTEKGVRVIECAARPGGGYITSHLIEWSTGESFHKKVIKLAMGETVNITKEEQKSKQYAGMIILLPDNNGIIEKISGISDSLELRSIEKYIPAKYVGDHVSTPPESYSSYYGVYMGVNQDYENLYKDLYKAKKLSKFELLKEK